ncbi:MAG: BatA domain-containing protein [Aggregatilineales bacterium]
MSLLTPAGLLAGFIAIPILLLYMLRLRRREVFVSSNFLWQQILQDTEANTPWQRLRRNILLFLQLLILALLVLALARPAQPVETISAGRTVVLLDASASMNATDINDETRFSEAKREALKLLGEMSGDDEMSIIHVADLSTTLVPYTGDINALRVAINETRVSEGGADWNTALTLAAAGAKGAEFFNIIIIGDGGLDDSLALPENIPQPIFIPIGNSSDNLALTALATRARAGGNPPQLFAQVENYRDIDTEVSVNIRLDGILWKSQTQTISERSRRSFIFSEVTEDFTTLEATLTYDDDAIDHLSLDDSAWTIAQDNGTRRVLIVEENENVFLNQILRSLPGIQSFRGDTVRGTLPQQPYDLYIFNGWLPDTLPDADMLIINPPRSTELFQTGELIENPGALSLNDNAHPLTAFVDVDSVNIRAITPITGTQWGQSLIETDEAAVLIAGEDNGRQIVIMPFELLDSDLMLQIAFPILMSNLLDWFTPPGILENDGNLTVGDSLRIRPASDITRIDVTLPDDSSRTLTVNSTTLTFTETYQPGLYTLDLFSGDTAISTQQIAVNLFGTDESNITPRAEDDLNIGGGDATEDAEANQGWREFWSILAFLGLLVLLYEWWVYHQRLQRPTATVTMQRSSARRQ